MFTGCILLLALITAPDDIDSIRTERIDEVIVTSNSARQRLQSVQAGAEQLQLKELTTAPQLFGETDIMRSIQLLPGIKAESDASSSFQVRGGTSAQNLVLFDSVLDEVAQRELVNLLMEKCPVAAVFSGSEPEGWRYIIGSETVDLRKNSRAINAGIQGRGGGSPRMIQGRCTAGG